MKKLHNILALPLLFAVTLTLFGTFLQSCDKEELDTDAVPEIQYIRITDPTKSDSLLVSAYLGNTIAIIGKNLKNVEKILFNDQEAYINTSYITDFSIIVTIPMALPGKVTNEITMVTKSDITVKHPFMVQVPSPRLNSLSCEYAAAGEEITINGNYFIDDPNKPLKVYFPGNIEAEIVKVELTKLTVKVPEGAGVGQISVKSLYGGSRSSFYFRDDRNIILDFDGLTAAGGWRSGVLGNSNPSPVKGNYVRFTGAMLAKAGATWNEDGMSFNLWPQANGRPNVPLYTGVLSNAVIKFEVNVLEPWKSGALQMIFTPYATNGTNSYIGDAAIPRGLWAPWQATGSYKTTGWTTVTLPLSQFNFTPAGGTSATAFSADFLGGLTFFVWNGGVDGEDCNIHMCIDNIRVVPQ